MLSDGKEPLVSELLERAADGVLSAAEAGLEEIDGRQQIPGAVAPGCQLATQGVRDVV
jgi:hypothetical protein